MALAVRVATLKPVWGDKEAERRGENDYENRERRKKSSGWSWSS